MFQRLLAALIIGAAVAFTACGDLPTTPPSASSVERPTRLAYACPNGWQSYDASNYWCDGGVMVCDGSSLSAMYGCDGTSISLCPSEDSLLGCGTGYGPAACLTYSVMTGTCTIDGGGGSSGGGGTYQAPPSDSVPYEEMVALTQAVTDEMSAMAALWDDGVLAMQAPATGTRQSTRADSVRDPSQRSSSAVVTPETALDLIALLFDLHEIVVAGPTAGNVSMAAVDLAGLALPFVPSVGSVRILQQGAKASKLEGQTLYELLRRAKIGREKHREFSEAQKAAGQIGARRITQIKNGKPQIGYIDGANIRISGGSKIFEILELKPSHPEAVQLGEQQLQRYKAGLLHQGTFTYGGGVINFADGWEIVTRVVEY